MRRICFAALVLAAVCVVSAPALGELCPACKGKMYTMDIGVCAECGGDTSSGAFKLCKKCSDKLGQCEHCRAALKGKEEPAPPPKPAKIDLEVSQTYTQGEWKYEYKVADNEGHAKGCWGKLFYGGQELAAPQGNNDYYETPWGKIYWVGSPQEPACPHGWMPQPAPGNGHGKLLPLPGLIAERIKSFKDNADKFVLELRFYPSRTRMIISPKQAPLTPYDSLMLSVPAPNKRRNPDSSLAAQISKDQASVIIDQLAKDGFLGQAADITKKRPSGFPNGPAYTLQVWGPPNLVLYEDLGRDFGPLLKRLQALHAVLAGDSSLEMAKLIERLKDTVSYWKQTGGKL